MDHRRCTICGDWGWFGSKHSPDHACKPKWECRGAWEDWNDAEWTEIRGGDSEEAAERFAEDYDCNGGEYAIVSNRMRSDTVVYVREQQHWEEDLIGPRLAEVYSIEAEAVPTYRAHKIERRA